MSIHLPIRSLRPLHRQCLTFPTPKRAFSTTPTLERGLSSARKTYADPIGGKAQIRQQKLKAPSAQQEEQYRNERNLPEDVGLIPGTFVHAPMSTLTRFSLKDRISYEWRWIRARLTSWYQLRRFRKDMAGRTNMFWFGRANRKMLRQDAILKYKALYESFARADSKAISAICSSGVAKEFEKRIASRPAGVRMQWDVQGEPSCKIVSNLATPLDLPGYKDTGIHQVVFRMQSKQSLELGEAREFRKKTEKDPATISSDVVEYFVLQKQYIRGKAKGWKIWGFTDFSTPKSIEAMDDYARRVSAYQSA